FIWGNALLKKKKKMRTELSSTSSEIDSNLSQYAKDIFASYDTVGDNKIYVEQLGEVLRVLDVYPTEADIKKYQSYFDSPEKRITFEEFISCFKDARKNMKPVSMEEIIEGLSHFDKEDNGMINVAELRHILTTLGERLKESDVDKLIEGHADPEGNIYISQFVKEIMETELKM
uniref:EF-hand domain-containing protein n=2 Tax=Strongyloides stercoralis TaxID=6248 RepID=A0AAF5HZ21_STRER